MAVIFITELTVLGTYTIDKSKNYKSLKTIHNVFHINVKMNSINFAAGK